MCTNVQELFKSVLAHPPEAGDVLAEVEVRLPDQPVAAHTLP